MGVLSQATGRGDVLLRRGVTESFSVRWQQNSGEGFEPVDLTGWTAECVFRSPLDQTWLTLPATPHADGLTVVEIPADSFTADIWAGRTQGNWFMNATSPTGRVERLGDGYFYLEG